MVMGNASDLVKYNTSISLNLNERGYGGFTKDSPATDANYKPNPMAPNWDFRVMYEAWIKTSLFANTRFGYLNFPYLHISPGKTGEDIVPLVPCSCPPSIGAPPSDPQSPTPTPEPSSPTPTHDSTRKSPRNVQVARTPSSPVQFISGTRAVRAARRSA